MNRRHGNGPANRRAGPLRGRGDQAPAQARSAGGDLVALDLEHRRRQRLHPLQRDHRRLLRPRPRARPLRRLAVRADRGDQLLHRDPPGAEGEGDPGRAGRARRPPRQGHSRRRRDRGAGERGRPRRRRPRRAGRPAGRRRRGDLQPRHDPRRVDADRRGRRGPQGGGRARAFGLLLRLRLRPLPGRRGAGRELRRQAGRRGPRLPPPTVAAAERGQPGDRRLDLRDGAAGGDPHPQPQHPQRHPRRGGADGNRGPGDADPRGPGAADERHLRGCRGAAGETAHPGPADERQREPGRGRHDLRRQDRHPDRRPAAPGRGRVRRRGRGRPRRRRRWPPSPPAPATATAPWRRSPSASQAKPSGSAPRSPSPRCGSGAAPRSRAARPT